MKFTSTTTLLATLALTASAAPLNERQAPSASSSSAAVTYAASSSLAPSGTAYYSAPYGTASSYAYATGTAAVPYPTGLPSGVQPPYPYSTGSSSCPVNGALVCSADGKEFGLCNWGRVVFEPVAAGTECKDGKIGFAQ